MIIRTLFARACTLAAVSLFATGCATQTPYDYTNFMESRPSSILVLPPLNMSPDILATDSVLSQVTLPLAESGYYVYRSSIHLTPAPSRCCFMQPPESSPQAAR